MPVASISSSASSLHDRGQGRNADVLEYLVAGGPGRALDAVEADVVEPVLVGDLDVVADAAAPSLTETGFCQPSPRGTPRP